MNIQFKKTSLPRQKTEYSGWLWKKGVLNRTNLTNRRWFEIKGDQLFYYKNKGDSNALGQVFLPGNKVSRVNQAGVADINGKYVFEIVAGKERAGRPVVVNSDSFLLGASTPMEMEGWIKAMNRVIYSPLGGGMFGRSIIETIRIDSRRGGGMVPIVVEKCVEFIREHGLDEEGVYRVPGNQAEVEQLKEAFNTGGNPDINAVDYKVNIVASVLKQYLGDLPEPVIPTEYWDQFIAVGELYQLDPAAALEKIEYLLQRIPRAHFNMLKYLCRFLFQLQLHEERTKMSVANLALVFAPNFLRPLNNDDPEHLLKSLASANTTTMCIIVNQNRLFPEAPDEKYYSPKAVEERNLNELMTFDSDDEVITASPTYSHFPTIGFPIRDTKRSLSDSNLLDIISNERKCASGFENLGFDDSSMSSSQVEQLKIDYQKQLDELERKLDSELKVREMLKLRLYDEHKARVAAEERLEQYRIGVEEYCKKFGNINISIP